MTELQADFWCAECGYSNMYELISALQDEGSKNFDTFRILMGESWREIKGEK